MIEVEASFSEYENVLIGISERSRPRRYLNSGRFDMTGVVLQDWARINILEVCKRMANRWLASSRRQILNARKMGGGS